ncbi:MAG: RluA family pseudouridine synthase [Tepidisphaera sp.]|nr:RluA family pseudouridine synthase [Tepidisphaera sp.]
MPKKPRDPDPAAANDASPDQATAAGLILPGGRINAETVRAALEQARDAAEATGEEADEVALRTVRLTLRHDLNKRLDKYLVDRIVFLSRNQIQRLIDDGGVTVNARAPKASTKLNKGDVVEVVVPEPPPSNVQPEDIPLDVMFEDQHMIVLNKQPDIIVHPARSHLKGTMLSALAFHFLHHSSTGGSLSNVGQEFARPGVVHRLDRQTSGCIVFAKTEEAHWKLSRQFEHRRVDKRYVALVHGAVEPDVQRIDLPLGPHPSREKGFREKNVVRFDDEGREAITIVRVRERYTVPGPRPRAYSLVELELKTGRTHQIRVHLSYNQWPIVGDDMYGGRALTIDSLEEAPAPPANPPTTPHEKLSRERMTKNLLIARQALHATVLGFRHPATDEPMQFIAPLRGDMLETVRALRAAGPASIVDAPGATVDLATLAP